MSKSFRPRMADYYGLLGNFHADAATAYLDTHRVSMQEAAENDPFVLDTLAFMRTHPNFTGNLDPTKNRLVPTYDTSRDDWAVTGTAAELYEAAYSVHLGRRTRTNAFFPSSPAKWSGELALNGEALRAVGVTVERKKVRGTKLLTLRHRPTFPEGADRGAATWSEGAATRSEGADTLSTIGPLETAGQDPISSLGGRGGRMFRALSTCDLEEEEGEGVGGKEGPQLSAPSAPSAAAVDGGAHAPWPNPNGLDWHDETGRVLAPLGWMRRNADLMPKPHQLGTIERWLDDETEDPDSRLNDRMTVAELREYMKEETPIGIFCAVEPSFCELFGIMTQDEEADANA